MTTRPELEGGLDTGSLDKGSQDSRSLDARSIAAPSLDALRDAIDASLAGIVDDHLADAPVEIGGPIRHAVLAPGKRVRPLLVLGGHRAISGSAADEFDDAVLRVACSVELVHAYSLVHDDLPCMDDDDLRRGRPTVHIQFSERAAVLAGAALMPMAVEVVISAAAGLDVSERELAGARLVGVLTAAAGGGGMVGGQLLDLEAEGHAVTRDDLDRIHEGKTAQLIRASCVMGGVAAGATEDEIERLGRYGLALGLAFQVVDDILDVTGSSEDMGKTSGRDAELGKASYPNVVGLAAARSRAAQLADTALTEIESFEGGGLLAEIARLVIDREH